MQTIDKTVRKGKILGLMSQARGGKPSPTLKLTHLGPTVIGTPSTEDVIILWSKVFQDQYHGRLNINISNYGILYTITNSKIAGGKEPTDPPVRARIHNRTHRQSNLTCIPTQYWLGCPRCEPNGRIANLQLPASFLGRVLSSGLVRQGVPRSGDKLSESDRPKLLTSPIHQFTICTLPT